MNARWLSVIVVSVLLVVAVVAVPAVGVDELDFDGDGNLDLYSRTGVLLGDGAGEFRLQRLDVQGSADHLSVVTFVDMDGDLILDGIASGWSADIYGLYACLGGGDGSFVCTDDPIDVAKYSYPVFEYIDGDDALDAIFESSDASSVCLGDGLGGFSCSDIDVDLALATALGDLDADGNVDAVFARTGVNQVCFGDGLGGFVCKAVDADSPPGYNSEHLASVALGDVDADGIQDIVFLEQFSEHPRECLGDGVGTFSCSDVDLDSGKVKSPSVALGDMNGDGHLDAVFGIAYHDGRHSDFGPSAVCLGDGAGGFTCSEIGSSRTTGGVTLGDFNGDGDLDAVIGSQICLGDGTGGGSCHDYRGVERIAGGDRYGTAAAVSQSQFGAGVPVAYVATGNGFADALAGGPVAALTGGPILLVDGITPDTRAELTRLQPDRIVILGGPAAVSDADAARLETFTNGPVTRIAGADRYATAAAISQSHFTPGIDVAYITTGLDFPDAFAGVPVAGINGGPILLTDPTRLPQPTRTELARLKPSNIIILGGATAVSDQIADLLESYTTGTVERINGNDRFATAAAISQTQFTPDINVVYVTTGWDYPDALAAGPVAGITKGPILLVNPDNIPPATAQELQRLKPNRIVLLGGKRTVSEFVKNRLSDFIPSTR